ncbi:hypothetical protein VNI00_003012 [Paramarasmius palmivorus]|uniref:xylan 1,4-beta-xylosidase n=1 Tax=Paramarasmius palmivorus TaxID=297713 RepID=A0AAW0DYK4_9AGAR
MTRGKPLITLLAFSSVFITAHGAFPDCVNGPLKNNQVCNVTARSIDRAKALVAALTTDEVIQNVDAYSPGVSRLGIPAYNWWSEALHGVGYSPGTSFGGAGQEFSSATSFPAPILMGAAFDDELIGKVADVINFFTPNINPYKDPRWGRGQETPGEDPFHLSQYVYQLISGLQGGINPSPYLKVAADCKHWAGYDLEKWNGIERFGFNAQMSLQDLAEYYSPSFQSCVRDAKASSVMCSYNAVNGVPSCANRYLLQNVVRELWELGDEQWIVSDCGAIGYINDAHRFSGTYENASAVALRAGTDIDCTWGGKGTYATHISGALQQGLIDEQRVRTALTRAYNSLVRLGYFDPPANQPYRQLRWSDVNTQSAQQLAYQAAVEGIVLLKNDGILPLASSVKRVALIGPWARATSQMQSNYNGAAPFLVSPEQAFKNAGYTVNVQTGTAINSQDTSGFGAAVNAANSADVVFYLGGIDTSIETEGLDRTEITWPGNQLDLIKQLANTGKPLVVLQMGGGQVDSSSLRDDSRVKALIWGGYPGQSGGTALVDIITGKVAPAGRLPLTQYPASYVNQVAMTNMNLRPGNSNPGRTYKWYNGQAVYEFGTGLHYTTFAFSWASGGSSYNIQNLVSAASGAIHLDLGVLDTFGVTVSNTGSRASDYVALLFSRTTAGPQPAPKKELVSYSRLKNIQPGSSAVASLKITLGTIARTDERGNRILYPGQYELILDTGANGKLSKTVTLTGDQATLIQWPQP